MAKFDFIEISRESGRRADINDVGENFAKIEKLALTLEDIPPIPPGVSVVDNLTSFATEAALSANQGRILNTEKAPIVSPSLNGIPLAPTPATGTNTSQIATTAFVMNTFSAISPPGDVFDFTAVPGDSEITLTWGDPEDGTLPIVIWAGTKIIRNTHPPIDEFDGVLVVDNLVRNQYATDGFIDTGLENGVTYHYQAFPRSETGAINRNIVNRTSAIPKTPIAPIFADNTWEQIAKAAANNAIPNTWLIGDTKNIILSTNETLTIQIAGKYHDDLADGSGKAPLTLGLKNLMATIRRMNAAAANTGGFVSMEAYEWLQNTIFPSLPADLQSVIKSVNKRTSAGNQSTTINTNAMKLFYYSEIECFGTVTNSIPGEGTQYPIFTDNNSRIKRLSNGTGAETTWYLRSPYKTSSSAFVTVHAGGTTSSSNPTNPYGVCWAFCI